MGGLRPQGVEKAGILDGRLVLIAKLPDVSSKTSWALPQVKSVAAKVLADVTHPVTPKAYCQAPQPSPFQHY